MDTSSATALGAPPPGRVLPPEPPAIRSLPHDQHGRPIPWFVQQPENPDGLDFRVLRRRAAPTAHTHALCWICGLPRARETAFVIGPMCLVNLTSAEPPSHRECAKYAADACPFLSTPHMRRRTTGIPDDAPMGAGVAVMRNPGVTAVVFCSRYDVVSVPAAMAAALDGRPGALFRLGPPTRVTWRASGRAATRAEVVASLDSGLPVLLDAAAASPDPTEVDQVHAARAAVDRWLPRA